MLNVGWSVEDLTRAASETIARNCDCFVAQWILQNPDANIRDYTLVIQPSWDNYSEKFSIVKSALL